MNRDEIICMMREAGLVRTKYAPSFHRLCEIAAAAEREACAKVLDRMAENDKLSNYFKVAALAIRERGQQ